MKKILFILLLLAVPHTVFAQQAILPCVKIPGSPASSCNPVTVTNPLPTQSN